MLPYRKCPTHASTNATPKTELHPTMLPPLAISKGLPPPDPLSAFGVAVDPEFELAAAAARLEVVVDTGTASGVVVLEAVVAVV